MSKSIIDVQALVEQFSEGSAKQGEALRKAVEEALSRLEQGSVLLAPLAASFDQFRDYKDRAQAFREAVFALGGEPWTPSSS